MIHRSITIPHLLPVVELYLYGFLVCIPPHMDTPFDIMPSVYLAKEWDMKIRKFNERKSKADNQPMNPYSCTIDCHLDFDPFLVKIVQQYYLHLVWMEQCMICSSEFCTNLCENLKQISSCNRFQPSPFLASNTRLQFSTLSSN